MAIINLMMYAKKHVDFIVPNFHPILVWLDWEG